MKIPRIAIVATLVALAAAACQEPAAPKPAQPPAQQAIETAEPGPRVVAFGDVHGDLDATRRVLKMCGAIDDADKWVGGKLVVVQTGDQLDRGDNERAILDLLERLGQEARAEGGDVVVLNGNHEVMNAAGDLRYITPGGFAEFKNVEGVDLSDPRLAVLPAEQRPRAAAFLPGGPYALLLAKRDLIAVVGDSVFAHGGVTPAQVAYGIDTINAETRAWLAGSGEMPEMAKSSDGPVWTRRYSTEGGPDHCDEVGSVLAALKVKRMVVGHTPQKGGITSSCGGKVWRVDVGLAAHYGGTADALEISADYVGPVSKRP